MASPVITGTPAAPTLAGSPIPPNPPVAATPFSARDWAGNNKGLLALLASGALGGTLGGVFSSRDPGDTQETRSQRRMRILKNVLGGTAAGAGIAGAGMLGYNALNQAVNEPSGGKATTALKAWGSEKGKGLTALAGGAAGATLTGRAQRKGLESQLFSKELPSEFQTPKGTGQVGLGRGKFTKDVLDSAFKNPTGTLPLPSGGIGPARSRASAVEDAIQQVMGHRTADETKAFVRGLGHTPTGESGLTAALKRNFSPTGTSSPSLFRAGKTGWNPRMLGGAAGTAAGYVLPDAANWLGGTYDELKNPTRNVGQPGS
jgi:hypothetical protein